MRLLADRVLVRPAPVKVPTTESGITLAESYYYAPEVRGTVLALGDGPRAEDGTLLPHSVAIGDDVIFPAEAGHDVCIGTERFIVLREDDLQAVVA
jgi:chaperonin GroES